MAKVSVVVVTYNALPWADQCFGSLMASDYPVDVVVVDNASSDNTVDYIRSRFPDVFLVEAGRNLGFGLANNLGMKLAVQRGAQYLFLLNQDAWVQPSTVGQLLLGFAFLPDTAVLSPLHLDGGGKDVDLYLQRYLREAGHSIGPQPPLSSPRYLDVPFVNAAAWFLPAELLNKVGGFDPIFFHYGEDRHFASRVLHVGGNIRVDTQSFVYHDRLERILKTGMNPPPTLDREWVHFLTQACHPSLSTYRWFSLKRVLRHSLLAIQWTIQGSISKAKIHAGLAHRILRHQGRIRTARQRGQTAALCLPSPVPPGLQIG